MAMIQVETLTDDCWKECDDFGIDTTVIWGDGKVYQRIHRCENVNKCRRIQQTIEDHFEKDKRR